MEEKKRKSSRTFELEKGGKRSFDLNKTSARKFDLAKESDEISLEELKKELLADGKIDAEEVNKLRDVLYSDGKIDQEEANFIFELNDAVSGKKNDPTWNQFFVQVVSDYLLNDEKTPGVIDEEEGKWLVEKIGADGKVDGVEKQLLDHLKKNAKKMPATVTALLTSAVASDAAPSDGVNLQQLKKELIADGKIDAEEVNKLRDVLYSDGKIDQEEANFIFELNDAVSGKKNDPTWNQFFVQVISDYLLNDEKSPGVIDEEEGKWLVEKIGADGQVDGVEKELILNLKKKAKSMPSSVLSLIDSENNRPTPEGETPEEKSSKWKWLIPAAIVVAAVPSYFLFSGNDDTPSEDQIVATAPEADQTNADDTATDSSASTGESENSNDVTNSDGSGGVDNTEGAGNPSGSGNLVSSDNSSETGNAGNASSGTKMSTSQSSDAHSPANNKANSASSNVSVGSSSEKAGITESSSLRGSSERGNSKNSGMTDNPIISGSIEQKALDVIRGIYGNGQVRKDKLGAEYAEIQKLVNEMYRNGRVK